MKYLILVIGLLVFIAGCQETDLTGRVAKKLGVETPTTTVDIIEDYEYCHPKLLRRYYQEDGSIVEICYKPEDLGLETCNNDGDCNKVKALEGISECVDNFCELKYTLIIDEKFTETVP